MKNAVAMFAVGFLSTLLVSGAAAQTEIGFRGAGGYLGMVDPQYLGSALGLGGFVDLGNLSPKLKLEGNLDYWKKSYEYFYAYAFSLTDVGLGGTVKYDVSQPGAVFQPYVGGGLGMHFLSAAGWSETKLGIDLLGGAQFGSTSNMKFFGELRYRLVSDVNQLCLRAGAVFFFGS